MLNLNGRSGPVGFALKKLEDSCRIWVKLLMDEALRVIWPERKSRAEPQRLIWSDCFALKMLEHFCRIWAKLLMNEALRLIWPGVKSHAELQRLIWSPGLRTEDA